MASACGGRLNEIDALWHLVVLDGKETAAGRAILTMFQADIDSFFRSKTAMYNSILETLTVFVGVTPGDLTQSSVSA